MPFVLNEDAAIHAKFRGLSVQDDDAPETLRNVTVRFRLPQTELANADFPLIVIDPAGPVKDEDREHRGSVHLPYAPEQVVASGDPVTTVNPVNGVTIPWDQDSDLATSPFIVEYPIPYNFDYTITVLTRYQTHLTELMLKLAQFDYIPARFGYLEVPADETVRSLFLIGGPEVSAIKDSDQKRLFRAVYRVRIPSELFPFQYKQLVSGDRILTIDLDVEEIS